MKKNDIHSIKNFINEKDALDLINFIDQLKSENKLSNERGDNTYRIYNSVEPVIKSFVTKYSNKFIQDQDLYVAAQLVALYEQGAFMAVHKDVNDDSEVISTVIYLNDDYSGGELSFPEIDGGYFYKPEKYELIHFPTPYLHGVNPVQSGKRYIMTISYTDKIENKDARY